MFPRYSRLYTSRNLQCLGNTRSNTSNQHHTSTKLGTRKHDELKQQVHAIEPLENRTKLVDEVKTRVKEYSRTPFNEFYKLYKPRGTHLESGAVKDRPRTSCTTSRLKAIFLVLLFMYCGGTLSSNAARLLHELQIFTIPEDNEDY